MSTSSGKSSDKQKTPLHSKDRPRRVFGRRLGRPLSPARIRALENRLPEISVPAGRLTGKADLDPAGLFEHPHKETWLEIGFGNGEHLCAMMQKHPDTAFLGAEPFINGMAAFLKSCGPQAEKHVRVLMDDALLLVHSLQNNCLARIYVLNPDPWPKKRHHKRRIINRENLDAFARILKPGGRLVMATDVDNLAEWMVTQCADHPDFTWTAETAADWQRPPADWALTTRYAQKGLQAGRRQTYLVFEKQK